MVIIMQSFSWRVALAGAVLLAASTAFPSASHAVSFDFTSCHITAGCGTAPFGTVTLTQAGANVNVSVSLSDSNTFAQTGSLDQGLFAFNATGVAATDIVNETGNNIAAGSSLAGISGTFTGPSGDFGSFGFAIQCQPTPGNPFCAGATPITTISFTVNNATIADLTDRYSHTQSLFVADVLIGSNGATGVIDAVPGPIVGAGLPGLVAACTALIALARRRRKLVVSSPYA